MDISAHRPGQGRRPFEAISELIEYSALPEVKRFCVPPGSAGFSWEAHWVAAVHSVWGAGIYRDLRLASGHAPAHHSVFVSPDDAIRCNR